MKIFNDKLWQCNCGVLNLTANKKCIQCGVSGPYDELAPSQVPPIDTESDTDVFPVVKTDGDKPGKCI